MGRDNLDDAKNARVLANLLARRGNGSFPMIGKFGPVFQRLEVR